MGGGTTFEESDLHREKKPRFSKEDRPSKEEKRGKGAQRSA